MDELQARFRSHRSLQTDMNLAKQPYPDEYSDDGQRQGEANVVELPSRQVHESASDPSPAQHSTAKRKQGAAKRKSATANQKAFPFRQMRDGHQQPYIDELKRLEAQAERINQLLAERKRKKAQAEQAESTNSGALPAALATKKKAAKGSRQTPRSPREVSPMPAQDDDTEALEAQAERIKQLLQELETALVAGEAPQPSEASAPEYADDQLQPSQASAPTTQRAPAAGVEPFASGTYRYGAKAQPFVEQPAPGTEQKAQQEATETAQALRYLASRDFSRDRGRDPLNSAIAASNQSESRQSGVRSRPPQTVQGLPSIRRYGLRLRQFLQIPRKSFDKVGDAVLWIVLAAAIRVGARFLLALFPALSPLFVLLMFAPAALAVYLVMFVPRTGFVSIYRLFLIMLGLLLGGRL